jgi:hypothetical protein
MWNEPEWEWFWLGSDSEYAQLLKVGYQATKAACPDCMVLFSGLHYWADPTFFERVLDILNDDPAALANNYFFDVMSVHFYSRSSNAYDMVNHIRTRMTTYVPDHPIWLTETGVPVWNDASVDPTPEKYDYAATMNEAAAYVIQSYANARASGVERYHFFRTHDESMGEYFGLIRNDLTLRPAYTAYQVATTYFITPTFTTRVQTGSHVRVTLWGTPRGKVTVLWNESPSSSLHTLAATLDTATLVDRRGSTETVSAVGGEFAILLAGATANLRSNPSDYIIGGEPVIVVETEAPNEPPISTILPLPEVTYIPSFTVSWQGQDNQAGVWRFDVQVRDGVDGEWQYVWHSTAATSGQFSGEDGHTYFFRARAMDRIGNQEDWPVEPQAHTALDLFTTLHLRVGAFFADENRNDVWDLPVTATNEITLTSVSLRLLDPAGRDVVSPEIGDSWRVTTTVSRGTTYELWAIGDDNMRMQQLPVPAGEEAYTYSRDSLGLWPVTRTYLPLVARDG